MEKVNSIENLALEDQPFNLEKYGPIFILGCPRSGTSFLSKCIATIDDLEEFVGVLVPPRFMHCIAAEENLKVKENMLLCTRDIFWQSFWRRKLFKHEKIIQVLKNNSALSAIWDKPNFDNSLFCYKEPFLCFAALDFAKHYSNSKFIHIIRDGRDNADSMVRSYPHALSDEVLKDENLSSNKVSEIGVWRRCDGYSIPWWVNEGSESNFIDYSKYERNLYMWNEMVTRAREVSNHVEKDRYLEIKYEDFVTSPISVSQRIFEFLGRTTNKRMNKKLEKAFATSIGINNKNRNVQEIIRSEKIAYTLLKDLGYIN